MLGGPKVEEIKRERQFGKKIDGRQQKRWDRCWFLTKKLFRKIKKNKK